MNARLIGGAAAALVVLAGAAWWARGTAPVQAVASKAGLLPASATPTTTEALHAAGIHKCQSGGGILYVDAACPKGSREIKAGHGTVTVMPFPTATVPTSASAVFGGALVKPMDREERDRLRDRQIEDASNRP